jgi:ABC-2 type transport system ATP-binding protein
MEALLLSSPSNADAVTFNHVSMQFGDIAALHDVSFRLKAGSICGLIGANGAGKTTLLRILCALLKPTDGNGEVLGESLHARPAMRRARMGYMAQHSTLYDELSVLENLQFRAHAMGLDQPMQQAQQALQTYGLASIAKQRVGTLSGGWRQRTAFAAALISRPELIVLDEPTAGVDVEARQSFFNELIPMTVQGVTVLISTHDFAEAARCDTLLMLHQGRVCFNGSPSQLLQATNSVAFHIQQTDAMASTALSKQLIALRNVIAADITPHGVRVLCEHGAASQLDEYQLTPAPVSLDDAVRTLLKRTALQKAI